MQASSVISLSPSFNTYSNSKMAEIAARVVEELGSEEFYDEEFYFEREEDSATRRSEEGGDCEYVERERENSAEEEGDCEYVDRERENRVEDAAADGEEEFEFAFVTRDSELSSPISADEIFHNGQIRPVYPLFNRDLFLESMEFQRGINGKENGDRENTVPTIRLPLRKLFSEERETTMTMTTTSSCSSSEGDELDGIPVDSYCVWRPKEAAAAAEGRCKKSSSTGSNSKRWKFKDLLHRSHSDGSKDDFVILSPSNSGRKKQNEDRGKVTPVSAGKVKSAAAPPLPPLYNRDGGEKRRSYLPYRQDLVGFFANVNGVSKNLQPF
ncbi:hypothetical protein C2S52_022592 [Perilla frutescens var. hirtella]|nr:hypothetical protein C2S52_022592 [Perilla frutescens var. hirtella]KAH6807032.1 hypothetical protein C2S51_028140 [Perilla frutescens var. frutescens]